MSLDRTIDALLPDWPPLAPSARAEVSAHCVAFVRAQLRLAPFHIRAGFAVLFTAYGFYALLRGGPFASRAARARSLCAFSALPLPMVNGVERLLRAATMLAYFDDALVLAALGERYAHGPAAEISRPARGRAVNDMLSCDVLVIGSGAGGASVAATLAEAGVDVLMLEEGADIPAAKAPVGISKSMLAMWRGGGLLTTLVSQIAFAEGRCVGGGTEINSAIFQRTPDSVLAGWADANGIGDLTPASLAPYFDRAAAAVNASLTPGEPGPPTDILVRPGAAMGWQVSRLERGQRTCVGTNLCTAACPTGGKQSMTATLIPKALARGARLIPQARVQRLIRRGNQVTGARALVRGEDGHRRPVTVTAQTVFLSAGTMQTPALLARSGLGGNAGRSFQLHPTIRVLARFPEAVNAHRYRLPLVAITEFMPQLRFGGSVFTLPTFGMAIAEDWQRRSAQLPHHAHHAIYYAMIRPDGVGRIHTLPGIDEPLVRYALTERDRRRLWDGARQLGQALLAAGAEHVTPSVLGHAGWADAGAIAGDTTPPDPGRTALMTIHLFASCPMGENRQVHTVDSFGRLWGAQNVIVADGSVLPGAPGVNPQATIMALAMRSADAFLAGRRA